MRTLVLSILLAGTLTLSAETSKYAEGALEHWAYQRLVPKTAPQVANPDWPLSPVDQFILAKMEAQGVSPAAPAEPETLVRRLYYVLCGLPPSAEDVVKWTRAIGPDLKQDVTTELVDTLLQSPRFGERWGRHWLDVVRYADSTGGDSNNLFPHAWRYRDYVIDSFNADKPFDDFVREQIAGDLLPIINDRDWAENLVATGFLAIGQKLVGEVEDRKFFADLVDEQIDATTRSFLGLTVSCARCHDHKSDPISQKDYYALASIFRNTETHYGLIKAQARQFSPLLDVTGLGLPADRPPLTAEELAELIRERDAASDKMDGLMTEIRGDGAKVTRANLRRSRTQRDRTETALLSYDKDGNPLTFIMGTQDRRTPLETRILIRGELDTLGETVTASLPAFFSPQGKPFLSENVSGRIELAEWIADPHNPLTSRVLANRLWYWLFGQGLVPTTDDFGLTGGTPSHPELLDYLAVQLVRNQWSLKRTIRELVLTRTWQQSTTFNRANFEKDPDNRLLWRANQRRLEAEAIRDAMLAVAGELDTRRPSTPLLAPMGEGAVGQNVFEPQIRAIEVNLRSVYLPRVRNVLPEALELFDAPDASNVSGVREVTTVPLQALYTLNAPFVQARGAAFAKRLELQGGRDPIAFAYLTAFSRYPIPSERDAASTFLRRFRMESPNAQSDSLAALATYCQALLCTAEFSVLD